MGDPNGVIPTVTRREPDGRGRLRGPEHHLGQPFALKNDKDVLVMMHP